MERITPKSLRATADNLSPTKQAYPSDVLRDAADEIERLEVVNADLLAALKDITSGWRYIRRVHGDLPGVGWARAQTAAEAAIRKAEGKDAP